MLLIKLMFLIVQEYNLFIRVSGGGLKGQSEAIQLAIAKALCQLTPASHSSNSQESIDNTNRTILKAEGLLTRDARCKERKKYGLKKARKASQFSKR